MNFKDKTIITIHAKINAPIDKVWKCWITPEDIVNWNYASDDWHTIRAVNDLRPGGAFNSRMEAKDGSAGFDFSGVYEKIITNKLIEYRMDDGRKTEVTFSPSGNTTDVAESFEAEDDNSVEMQRSGWQSILDNFKKYAEEQR